MPDLEPSLPPGAKPLVEMPDLSPEARRRDALRGRARLEAQARRRFGPGSRFLEVVKRVVTGTVNDGFIHAGNFAYMAILSLFPFFITGAAIFTLFGGLFGAVAGYWIAIWTSDYWPMVVGGKAIASWIPYTIICFELMVLVGGLSTVYGMFILSRVPKITQTVGFDPRFTGADYGIYVEAPPERLKEVEALLRGHGAVEVRNER